MQKPNGLKQSKAKPKAKTKPNGMKQSKAKAKTESGSFVIQ
jgi:hypothetical protein